MYFRRTIAGLNSERIEVIGVICKISALFKEIAAF